MIPSKLHPTPVSSDDRPSVSLKRPVAAAGPVQALPGPALVEEPAACTDAFLGDLREMCALIAEADRYGATSAMEETYRALRSRLAVGYRALLVEGAVTGSGFHGCGFEMILGPYSLEGLVRTSGVRAVERLGEVWRAVCPAV